MSRIARRIQLVSGLFVLAAACIPSAPEVATGPAACDSAEYEFDPLGFSVRGNVFEFDDEHQGVGLVTSRGITVLRTVWFSSGAVHALVTQGTQGHFGLEGGGYLVLAAAADAPPKVDALSDGRGVFGKIAPDMRVFTQWRVDFALGPDQLAQLSRARLTGGRTRASGYDLLMQPPHATGIALQTLAVCLHDQAADSITAPAP